MNGNKNVPTATGGGKFKAATIQTVTRASPAVSAMLAGTGSRLHQNASREPSPATGAENPEQSDSTSASVAPVAAPEQTSTAAPVVAPAAPKYDFLTQINSMKDAIEKFKSDGIITETIKVLITQISKHFTSTMKLRSDLQKLMKHYNFTKKQMGQLLDGAYLETDQYENFRKKMINPRGLPNNKE